MAKIVFLDTHVVAWLYAGETNKFPRPALSIIETSTLTVSPAVLLELQYLYEIQRVSECARHIMNALEKEIGLAYATAGFPDVMNEAVRHTWTRDPFDRMIVATAALNDSILISKDDLIRKHYRHTIWD